MDCHEIHLEIHLSQQKHPKSQVGKPGWFMSAGFSRQPAHRHIGKRILVQREAFDFSENETLGMAGSGPCRVARKSGKGHINLHIGMHRHVLPRAPENQFAFPKRATFRMNSA